MEEIIARQNAAAKPATGRAFVAGVASIVLHLAIAQVLVNLAIRLSGVGLLNILFYAYAVWLLVAFMTRTVAGNVYTLKEHTLILEKRLGDSTNTMIEIPIDSIVSVRPFCYGERLHTDYRQVTYLHHLAAPGARMHIAYYVSLVWAWLARRIGGRCAYKRAGYIVVYDEGGARRAVAIRPDETFLGALHAAVDEAFGMDERLAYPKLTQFFPRSLNRAFPGLYPQVLDVVTKEEIAWAEAEFNQRRSRWIERYAWLTKRTSEQVIRSYRAHVKANATLAARVKAFAPVAFVLAGMEKMKKVVGAWIDSLREDEADDDGSASAPQERRRRRRG